MCLQYCCIAALQAAAGHSAAGGGRHRGRQRGEGASRGEAAGHQEEQEEEQGGVEEQVLSLYSLLMKFDILHIILYMDTAFHPTIHRFVQHLHCLFVS